MDRSTNRSEIRFYVRTLTGLSLETLWAFAPKQQMPKFTILLILCKKKSKRRMGMSQSVAIDGLKETPPPKSVTAAAPPAMNLAPATPASSYRGAVSSLPSSRPECHPANTTSAPPLGPPLSIDAAKPGVEPVSNRMTPFPPRAKGKTVAREATLKFKSDNYTLALLVLWHELVSTSRASEM